MKLGRIGVAVSAQSSFDNTYLRRSAGEVVNIPKYDHVLDEPETSESFIRFVQIDGNDHELFPVFRLTDGNNVRAFTTPGYRHELSVMFCRRTGSGSTKLRTIELLSGEEVDLAGKIRIDARINNTNRRSRGCP